MNDQERSEWKAWLKWAPGLNIYIDSLSPAEPAPLTPYGKRPTAEWQRNFHKRATEIAVDLAMKAVEARLRPFAELIANAVPDSTMAQADEEGKADDLVVTEIPVTLGDVRRARKAVGRHWSDCAVHNAPALPASKCDCGGYHGE